MTNLRICHQQNILIKISTDKLHLDNSIDEPHLNKHYNKSSTTIIFVIFC